MSLFALNWASSAPVGTRLFAFAFTGLGSHGERRTWRAASESDNGGEPTARVFARLPPSSDGGVPRRAASGALANAGAAAASSANADRIARRFTRDGSASYGRP